MDFAGLLGKFAGLPGAIGQGLLGIQNPNPALGLDANSVQQARQQALTDLAMGMMAGRGPQGMFAATNNARQNYQSRVFDMLKEQEMARMMEQRKKTDAAQASLGQYLGGMGDQGQILAQLATLNPQGVSEVLARNLTDPATDSSTSDMKNYTAYVSDETKAGRQYLSFNDWLLQGKRAGATNVSVSPVMNAGKKFGETLGEKAATQLDALQTSADSAVRSIQTIQALRPLVDDPKFITGTAADVRVKIARTLGMPVEATQAYFAGIGQQVAERIKAFGAGTGLSDADRAYAEKIAGGSMELTAEAIKKILDMNETSSRAVISLYGDRRGFYMKSHPEVGDYYPEISSPSGWSVKRK